MSSSDSLTPKTLP